MEDETVWLSQAQMAELFQTTKQKVSLHINNAIKEGELESNSVVKESLTTAIDGKGVLSGAGEVSHQKALDKARNEYEKYKRKVVEELSPVEKEFLISIKDTHKKLKGKVADNSKDKQGNNESEN